jgi:hypothetical protein
MSARQDENPFAGVKTEEVEVLGKRYRFPIKYYDHTRMSAVFAMPASGARELLPSAKLRPIEAQPGVALIDMSAYEYHDIDGLAPYNEFAISVPVLYDNGDAGFPGIYIVDLPVTTEESMLGGIELWGFPKFLAEIQFEDTSELRRCIVRAEGKHIVTVEVKKTTAEPQSMEGCMYSIKGNQIIRTPLACSGEWASSRVPGAASCVLGDHPVAEKLRKLGLGTAVIESTYAPRQRFLLELPGERLPM